MLRDPEHPALALGGSPEIQILEVVRVDIGTDGGSSIGPQHAARARVLLSRHLEAFTSTSMLSAVPEATKVNRDGVDGSDSVFP